MFVIAGLSVSVDARVQGLWDMGWMRLYKSGCIQHVQLTN